MSDKQFEECSFQRATHVEINGVVYEIAGNICTYNVGLRLREEDVFIPEDSFPLLGIKPLKKIKQEPIEFEATFVKYGDKWHPRYSLAQGWSYQNCKTATFRCVEILEEEEK